MNELTFYKSMLEACIAKLVAIDKYEEDRHEKSYQVTWAETMIWAGKCESLANGYIDSIQHLHPDYDEEEI